MNAALSVMRVAGPAWWRQIKSWITDHHRHHRPPQGWRYGFIALRGAAVVGLAVVGRPVARRLAGAECTRLCTWGSSRRRWGAASALLRAVAEAEPEVVTYTLASEEGRSLEAAGWYRDGPVRPPRRWSCRSRPRAARLDEQEGKQRWRPIPREREQIGGDT